MSASCSQVWAVGLDSCDDALSILKRDLDTGRLTPTTLVRPVNPNGNSINIDKASQPGVCAICYVFLAGI